MILTCALANYKYMFSNLIFFLQSWAISFESNGLKIDKPMYYADKVSLNNVDISK